MSDLSLSSLAHDYVLVRRERDEALAEVTRLRKLFDDAGQGEHNVMALIDFYQRDSMESDERRRAALADLDALRVELARAVRLLHMLDNQEARHPDVAEFLDQFEESVLNPSKNSSGSNSPEKLESSGEGEP